MLSVRTDITCEPHETPVVPAGERTSRRVMLRQTGAPARVPGGWALPVATITLFLVAAHGWALWDGLFFDDHLHRLRYADDQWSFQALLDASTVKPDEFIHTWWQEETIAWHYTRPFSILLGKVVYQLSGGRPAALHALNLLLHLGSSIMVFVLARMLTRRTGWATVAGLLFVVYSHSVYAVAWLAAQNSVLQTFLTLAAMLAYIRASRLDLYAAPDESEQGRQEAEPQPAHRGWFLLSVVLWGLALLSRETAVVLPVMLVALDLAFGGWRQVRARIPLYGVLAIAALAFLVWRLSLAYHPIPDFYVRRYDGPGYIAWYIAKLMHWITSAIWLSPMTVGPTARINPFLEVPGDCLLMLAIIVVMTGGYCLACRRARGWWLWPLWVLLVFLPVVPVMAGPQSGYPAGVGFALAMVLGPALRDRLAPVWIGRWSKPIAIWFLIATCIYIPIYRKMWYSMNATERATIAGLAACPPPPTARDLYFINLPFVNIYAGLHVREALDAPDRALRAHVLTYAPNLLRVEYPTIIEQLDAHRFRVRMTAGRPYFSGALGRFLIESMRPSGRLRTGERVRAEGFDVTISEADADGVRELEFAFDRPLASPEHAFYVTTNQFGAMRVKFWEGSDRALTGGDRPAQTAALSLAEVQSAAAALEGGNARAAETLFTAMASDDTTLCTAAGPAVRSVAGAMAAALAAPVQDAFDSTALRPDWARVRAWWQQHVDDEVLQAFLAHRETFEQYRRTQQSLFNIRAIAARIIRTDLYMTGPPFPSPR